MFGHVLPAKVQSLQKEMARLGILETDLEESFIRGSGPGGQKINKSSSGVYLKHLPTGTEVKCQQERSQVLNRFLARRILVEKIARQREGEKSLQEQRWFKIRKQKERRSRRAKEKMLSDKKIHSEKKAARKNNWDA